MGWTTVCIKTKKKKQKPANFIIKTEKTIFLSDCKSVYKCTACGCVRGCVIGKVYQHLNYCEEIFQVRALMKAHVRLDISSLQDSFTVELGILHHLLDDTLTHFREKPFYVKSH